MKYNEDTYFSSEYKQDYLSGLINLIENRENQGEKERAAANIFDNPDKHRENLKKMLGWPLIGYNETEMPAPTSVLLSHEDGYDIFRMSFEFLPNVHMHGLFFKHSGDKTRPFAIVQHGGQGTPESISGILGSTANYNNMAMRVLNKGINIFAPQLLLWDKDTYGVGYDRQAIDAQLRRVGSSITAVEIFAITKIIDFFEMQPYTSSIGMVGLSYGGFYTLFTHAVDKRIKAAVSCSFYNERKKYPWNDWAWMNAAYTYSDAEICCLTYPRKLWIEVGNQDELFDINSAKREIERFENLSRNITPWVKFRVFDGYHEFYQHDDDINAFAEELLN